MYLLGLPKINLDSQQQKTMSSQILNTNQQNRIISYLKCKPTLQTIFTRSRGDDGGYGREGPRWWLKGRRWLHMEGVAMLVAWRRGHDNGCAREGPQWWLEGQQWLCEGKSMMVVHGEMMVRRWRKEKKENEGSEKWGRSSREKKRKRGVEKWRTGVGKRDSECREVGEGSRNL